MASEPAPEPDATGSIDIDASAEAVYALVSDPGALASLSTEYSGYSWLGGATHAVVGARFRGWNRKGLRRWVTVSTVTDASVGSVFAFDVAFGPLPIARWRYDIEPTARGCRVTESTWDHRRGVFRAVTTAFSGVRDRPAHNRRNIALTLAALKTRVEDGGGRDTRRPAS